jgi:uncharacterized membrane protein YraQ (UPF0718 family)
MEFLSVLYNFLLESSPFLLFGFLLSGLFHSFFPFERVQKWFGQGSLKDIFMASAIGVPLPLCSCGVIPAAVTLKKNGASNAATSAFLISTPETGVDSISLTYALMDLPMTIIRPVAAFFSAFCAGILNHLFNRGSIFTPVKEEPVVQHHHHELPKNKFYTVLHFAFVELIDDLFNWLALGILLGAAITYFIPPDFFSQLSPLTSRLAITLIGVPLYICASASTPIAASLIMKGMSPGTALILLMVGPATNITNMVVLKKYIGSKGIALNVLAIVVVAWIFSYITDFLYAHYFVLNFSSQMTHDHGNDSVIAVMSTIIFLGVMLASFKRLYFKKAAHDDHSCCH